MQFVFANITNLVPVFTNPFNLSLQLLITFNLVHKLIYLLMWFVLCGSYDFARLLLTHTNENARTKMSLHFIEKKKWQNYPSCLNHTFINFFSFNPEKL